MQYDSWWYRRGSDGGVTEWIPDNSSNIFPNGKVPPIGNVSAVYFRNFCCCLTVLFFHFKDLPSQMHNRYWSRSTEMGKKGFTFIKSDPKLARRSESFPAENPNSNQFRLFYEIMQNAKTKYNLTVYEQDWLQVICILILILSFFWISILILKL